MHSGVRSRESPDSRFVTLTMPRVLSRLPYGEATLPTEEFGYEEFLIDEDSGLAVDVKHEEYCWMNAAYSLATKMTHAFADSGFCTAIRGVEGGGKVDNLPAHTYLSEEGDPTLKCPTEVGITDRREAELGKQGLLPLCHYKNTNYAVFFGGQTCQKSIKYDSQMLVQMLIFRLVYRISWPLLALRII